MDAGSIPAAGARGGESGGSKLCILCSMRFWLDTEFDDGGREVELISLGVVAEDGREFYAISTDFDPATVKPWVRENVLPHLEPRDSAVWKPLSAIAAEFLNFVGGEPAEFWSLIATYDWYLLTRLLFGGLDDLPSNWPFECWDLHQWAWHLGDPPRPSDEGLKHHALADAHRHRRIFEFLAEYERRKHQTA